MTYSPYIKQVIDDCKIKYNVGSTINDLIELLHDQGLTLSEVCTVLASVLDIEPSEAQIFVADHPVWVEVVDQSSPIIGEIMQVLQRDGKLDDLGDGVVIYREPRVDDIITPFLAVPAYQSL